MKTLKFLLMAVALFLSIGLKAQNTHNYFSSEVYPGLYAQITFGNNYILFSHPPKQALKLNYSHSNNGWNYYSYRDFVVMVSSNGAVVSTNMNGRTIKFTYVGPVGAVGANPYNGGSNNSSETLRRMKCHFCNGTGRVKVNDHIPQYSLNSVYVYKKCGECGEEFNRTTTNHYHINCSKCFGNGYIER